MRRAMKKDVEVITELICKIQKKIEELESELAVKRNELASVREVLSNTEIKKC